MFKLLALTLLVCSAFGVPSVRRQAGLISLPDSNIGLLREAGLSLLQDEIISAGNSLVHSAKLVNETQAVCTNIIESYLQGSCKLCVENKCQEKAETCSPGLWAFLLQQVEGFFNFNVDALLGAFNVASGLPDFVADVFHLDEVSNLFVDVGTDALNTVQTVGNVFGEVGGSVLDVGTGIWDGVTDVAGSLGEAVLGVGGSILSGIGDVGSSLVDGFFGTIGGAVEGIGSLLGGLFNRRVRNAILQYHVKRQVRSEPTCAQLQNEGGNACLLYASSCGNVCDTKWLEQQYCSAFQAAMADYQGSVQQHYWVTTMPPQNQNYVIDQVLVDGSSFDATVGGYTSSTVTVTLFGETYTFSLDSPLTMFDMTQAGQEIAQKALDQYKSRHPAPTTKRI
ncbi:uncharacterized protein [Branchiostoma lanceolatum]|uniref:uncharacterized protein isoform X1 n=1 Tax=Branchiostoma lanceolatum TaxID=7740 RepID=UPI003454203D